MTEVLDGSEVPGAKEGYRHWGSVASPGFSVSVSDGILRIHTSHPDRVAGGTRMVTRTPRVRSPGPQVPSPQVPVPEPHGARLPDLRSPSPLVPRSPGPPVPVTEPPIL